ncbi:MAG: MotE family protein [Minwuia sp.]|uniref:MotE family protein n=1 Tax=Minwuia sp. TaxID=2493630 RepID=UPI003A88A03D
MRLLQVRLLPVTLIVLVMVLGVRVSSLFDGNDATTVVTLPMAFAEEKAEKPDEAMAEEKDDAGEKAAEAEAGPEPGTLAGRDPTTFSPAEIALLENLASRREEIEKRAAELDVRESLLAATEQRLDEKIADLKSLESRIENLVKKHDEAEEERMARLVTVYEKMKAKDAARIFEQIEMDILIDVAARMKEAKVADVMANMSAQRAQELTIELATRNDIESRIKR